MLTVNTQIPTLARGQIRALVKAHKDWRLFLEAKEIISADAKNRDLLEFALFHPTLVAQIEQILDLPATEGAQAAFLTEAISLLALLARTMHPKKLRVRVPCITQTL